jgi:cellular nucleic acid-binding protein
MNSEHTEQSEQEDLTEDQKKTLLENFPQPNDDGDDSDDENEDMFRQDDDDEEEDGPPRKKANTSQSSTDRNATTVAPELLTHAKAKLSKWAARLFDPNRIRGLVEAPQVIPLNDEFLKAFGQREKEFDSKLGRTIQIDRDEIVGGDDHDSDEEDAQQNSKAKDAKGDESSRKIKITNLGFTTTQQTLTKLCNTYGPTSFVNIVMEKNDPQRAHLNIGKAYVTFERVSDAQACMDHMTTCEGRKLRLSWAQGKVPSSSTASGGRNSIGKGSNRYWVRDISTKCFRCQQVGHLATNCPNPNKVPPCPLCGNVGANYHDLRDCALSRFCFRCGLPGHINRDCPAYLTIPRRIFCSICFGSGHYRTNCRQGPLAAADLQKAKCMVCGEIGHFMCREMKWFFGLDGVTCFNCGGSSHHGYKCERPRLEQCSRDETVAKRELEQAPAMQLYVTIVVNIVVLVLCVVEVLKKRHASGSRLTPFFST